MSEDFNNLEEENDVQEDASSDTPEAPEPPRSWRPNDPNFKPVTIEQAFEEAQVTSTAIIGKTSFTLKGAEIPQFQAGRRFTIISQVVAGVSLFFGGVLLSALAVVFAFMARDKFSRIAAARPNNPEVQKALTRPWIIAMVISIGILILNILAMVYLYPMVADSLQSGSLYPFGGATGATGTGATNATWG